MLTIKAHFRSGNTITTGFNGLPSDAVRYYLWKEFNLGTGGEDFMDLCIAVDVNGERQPDPVDDLLRALLIGKSGDAILIAQCNLTGADFHAAMDLIIQVQRTRR
ncbi:MAG TPA: hypothetical protein VGH19_06895 [Verrucomicrobiae bacterium]